MSTIDYNFVLVVLYCLVMRLEGSIHSDVYIDGIIDGIQELVVGQDVTLHIGPYVSTCHHQEI